MKKCNYCGKTISDFAEHCPYCFSDPNDIKKKDDISAYNAKSIPLKSPRVLFLHLVISSIVLVVATFLLQRITYIELVKGHITVAQLAFWNNAISLITGLLIIGTFLMLPCKKLIVSFKHNKWGIIAASIGGGLALVYAVIQLVFGSFYVTYDWVSGIFAFMARCETSLMLFFLITEWGFWIKQKFFITPKYLGDVNER